MKPISQLPEQCALYIAEGLTLSGRIDLDDDRPIVIAGHFEGVIDIQGELIVMESGEVSKGPISAGNITLSGTVKDIVSATVAGLLDIKANAQLNGGTVRYNELVLARGAVLNAALESTASGVAAPKQVDTARGLLASKAAPSVAAPAVAAMAEAMAKADSLTDPAAQHLPIASISALRPVGLGGDDNLGEPSSPFESDLAGDLTAGFPNERPRAVQFSG